TDELILKLAKDNDDHVDQKAVLKARLLDNFIMDFDRHEDQWRWATYDTGKGKIYYPIPRDHDQMFFVNQGILPYFVRKPWVIPEIQGFRSSTDNIETFNKPARNFDRFFLTELNEEDWSNQIDTFLAAMTDEVIERSLHLQPREVQGYSMNSVINTLKNKRKYFRNNMMDYYRFISKKVNVIGSNQRELFTITKQDDGKVSVVVNKIDKSGNISSKIYDRTFDPGVTQIVHLYGLSDSDRFVIAGGDSPIKIRVIGGPGNDEFINNGTGGKVLLYDASFEENKISGNPGLKNKFTVDAQGNRYDRLGYKYDIVKPGLSVAYNVDDGLYLGARIEIIKQGFRKEPYRMRQYLAASRALRTASYRFNYQGEYIKVIGNNDLLLNADVRAPVNVTNFFGLGNETVFDETKPGKEKYYRARYDLINASVILRRQLQSWMRINYGPAFQHFKIEKESNQDKFIAQPSSGLNQADLYTSKLYAGLLFKLDINSKNSPVIPTRGFVMDLNIRPLLGLNSNSNRLAQAEVDMRIFASIFKLPWLVLGTRLGYGRNFGDFEVPQAYYLGGTENLRGYRRDRFAGRTMLFNNTELRIKIKDFNTYLFPGQFGILLFNDVGRVWVDDDNSTDWHVGNGAGIWIAPISRFVVTASVTRSKEEKVLPLVTFGFQF
ncbi:MAG: BamA/TamA family outer membrane protein, partial [Chitinophagaceae bacterium]